MKKILAGYNKFREKYAQHEQSIMQQLSFNGQNPETMVIACSDSRVDPALITQSDHGDLFVVRNVANIVPPYEPDDGYHGTSAALEFAIKTLKIKNLILMGHSQCGGIQHLLPNQNQDDLQHNDFITKWVSILDSCNRNNKNADTDECAKLALQQSYKNCLSFPWIKKSVDSNQLIIHLWFFDIKSGTIFSFNNEKNKFLAL